MPRFEKLALTGVIFLVIGLILLALITPLNKKTGAPRNILIASEPKNKEYFSVKRLRKPFQFLPIGAYGAEELLGKLQKHPDYKNQQLDSFNSAQSLHVAFSVMGYDLDSVSSGKSRVPRLFLVNMPSDIGRINKVKNRKGLFFLTILPLIVQVNEEIMEERRRFKRLRKLIQNGFKIKALDRLWLIVLAERYKVERYNWKALMERVDLIPPSLALAQGAEESGWGGSRFVQEGNAVFGQWTLGDTQGIVPAKRDAGKTHRIKRFKSLLDSVRAYALNLNTHRAYHKMRNVRSKLRNKGLYIQGVRLAKELNSYSERGQKYVNTLLTIIRANKLGRLDNARFAEPHKVISPI